ncbi:hypothetical protein GOARA_064_02030 [Gordonia araii NBRC 100433]|uniref:Uncharacterized protein n=1 Tax=Gordonia araii NBRC 100433 TaxID=1073574 RepID=G7H5S6_9ACTN|nr:hypothetical protein [Gordonia araii]NNG95911.1 hypothetical protein [Gordonia araii NBRC 100433]GAB11201.1 hypothetical protein GOARA_064_02030 [Gordonia araii NBRC 100433]
MIDRLVMAGIVVVAGLVVAAAVGPLRPHALLVGGAVAAVILGVLRLSISLGARSAPPPQPWDSERDDALVRWQARTRNLIAWADGTRGDWDRHLRPILAREFLMATGNRHGAARRGATAGTLGATGRMTFGPELWPWVDPLGANYADRDQPGPGRDTLDAILKQLEQL